MLASAFHIKGFLHISGNFVCLLILMVLWKLCEHECGLHQGRSGCLFPYETLRLVSSSSLSWTDQLPQRSSFSLLHGRYIPACQGLEAERAR